VSPALERPELDKYIYLELCFCYWGGLVMPTLVIC
jgi:hypothetical protein